ncbi:MAG: LOG family protein, partial [Methylobacterium sp.]|nr:LOG family protein [Methylobacterium sp.]
GCMQAASRGAAEAGGLVIGVLTSTDPLSANPFVSVPIASGIGEARNAIIASACFALVAVGGGHGTLSEIALGLKMERLVIAMPDANRVDGALECAEIETTMEAIAGRYFRVAS